MADDNKLNDDESKPKKAGEFNMPPRTWILWIAIFCGVIVLMLFRDRLETPDKSLTQYNFTQKVDSNLIAKATINYNPQSPFLTEVVGTYYKTDNAGNILTENGKQVEVPFRTKARLTEKMEEKLLATGKFEPREPNTMLLGVVWSVLPSSSSRR